MSNEYDHDHDVEGFSLEALRVGDRVEFSRLMEANYGKIYRLAMKILNHPEDAEDVLQETFLKAYKHMHTFNGRSKLSTWLYRIATNEALMSIRRRRANVISMDEPQESEEGEQEPVQIVDWSYVPEDKLMTSEGMAYLDQAVDRLPYNLRVVFLLRDIEDLSTQETADVLSLSETAVKTRLSRARMRLREDLSTYYHERLERQQHGTA
jgi:RNA polymerase sigma-70 factor (ECF subfamily)